MTISTASPTEHSGAPTSTPLGNDPHTGETTLPRWSHGHVAWFNAEKGFGFITPDSGVAVFVEYTVIDGAGYKTLTAGQPVVFTAIETARGPEATRVVPYTRTRTTPPLSATRYRSHRCDDGVHRPGCRNRTP